MFKNKLDSLASLKFGLRHPVFEQVDLLFLDLLCFKLLHPLLSIQLSPRYLCFRGSAEPCVRSFRACPLRSRPQASSAAHPEWCGCRFFPNCAQARPIKDCLYAPEAKIIPESPGRLLADAHLCARGVRGRVRAQQFSRGTGVRGYRDVPAQRLSASCALSLNCQDNRNQPAVSANILCPDCAPGIRLPSPGHNSR